MNIIMRWCRFVALAGVATAAARDLPAFRERTIATGLTLGYQLVAADINGDGRQDLIAVDERGTELAWYENPGWQRHVIIANVPRTINVDVSDIDGDGIPEIAILYRFESRPEKSIGIMSLLHHDGDPRKPWKETEIDRVPSAHRVRWADLDGTGRRFLIMAPMVGLSAEPPLYDTAVPIYLYRPGAWKRELLSDELRGVLHGIYPVDLDRTGSQQLLTASFLGLRLFRPSQGAIWKSETIGRGDPDACPKCGSSEVALGHLGKQRFLAAIEPWHGNQVAIYLEGKDGWTRQVIDDSFQNGHALAVGDLNGDGRDEVVAGYRGKGYQVYIYRAANRKGTAWTRTPLGEGGMAAVDCKIRDFTGDGLPDIACVGASTGNIKLYENAGR